MLLGRVKPVGTNLRGVANASLSAICKVVKRLRDVTVGISVAVGMEFRPMIAVPDLMRNEVATENTPTRIG